MNEIRNIKTAIAFKGTAYHGFQTQNGAATIQGVIEQALSRLLNADTAVTGCGRTDAGVHAREYVLNFRTDSSIPESGIVRGLNALLPHDIAVLKCEEVSAGFHARYSAKYKEYSYLIYNGHVRDVFSYDTAYFYPRYLDVRLMEKTARLFIGEHDFSAYCKAESLETVKAKKRGTIRGIIDFEVWRDGHTVEFIVKGDGFLHNMVRIMAGTLVYVSEGKITPEGVSESLNGNLSRTAAGVTLPPHGLYLNRVDYGE